MNLNLIQYQKSSVTYSSETTSTNLGLVHTIKESLVWTPSDNSTFEWLKINLYYVTEISKVVIDFNENCDSLKLEYSNDNIYWYTAFDTWIPDRDYKEITFDAPIEMVYIRLVVNNPSTFVLNDIKVYSDVTWSNKDIISHNYFAMYGINFREKYPVIPSMTHDRFKMFENYNNVDLKLFDSNLYTNTTVTCVDSPSGTGTLGISNLTVVDGLQYIWDYDDPNFIYAYGIDGSASASGVVLSTDIDLSDYSIDELATKALIITSGINEGSYTILNNTNNSSSNSITITGIFTLDMSNATWKIQELSESELLLNPNIIITDDPVIGPVNHEYTIAGIYYPRLICKALKYQLEFITKFIKM